MTKSDSDEQKRSSVFEGKNTADTVELMTSARSSVFKEKNRGDTVADPCDTNPSDESGGVCL